MMFLTRLPYERFKNVVLETWLNIDRVLCSIKVFHRESIKVESKNGVDS